MKEDLYQKVAAMMMSSPEAKSTRLSQQKVEALLRHHFPTEEGLRRRYFGDREEAGQLDTGQDGAASKAEVHDLGFPPLNVSFDGLDSTAGADWNENSGFGYRRRTG